MYVDLRALSTNTFCVNDIGDLPVMLLLACFFVAHFFRRNGYGLPLLFQWGWLEFGNWRSAYILSFPKALATH